MWPIRRLPNALQQAAYYGFALILAKGASFAMVPVFTNFLSPAEFAVLDVIQTLADLLSVLMGLGLADTLFRFAGGAENDAEQRRVAGSILGLALLTGAAFLIVGQLAAPAIAGILPWPSGADHGYLLEVRIVLVSLSCSAIIMVPFGWLRMRDKAAEYLYGAGGRALLQAGLVALALFAGFGVLGVLTAGMAACVALAGFVVYRQARDTGIHFDLGLLSRYGGYAAPLIGIGLLAFLTRSADRWIVAANVDAVSLAHYALAAKFGLMTAVLLQPYEMWWFPRRFAILKQEGGKILCARRGELGLVAALLAALLVAAFSPAAITLLTPDAYHAAVVYVPALAALTVLHAASSIVNLGAYSGNNTYQPFLAEGATAAIAVGLAVLLVPAIESRFAGHGAWGAVAAGGAALLFRLAVIFSLAQRHAPVPYRTVRLLGAAAIGSAGLTGVTVSQWEAAAPLHALAIGMAFLACLGTYALAAGLLPIPQRLKRYAEGVPFFSSQAFFLR